MILILCIVVVLVAALICDRIIFKLDTPESGDWEYPL